jgi:hypothetical protein
VKHTVIIGELCSARYNGAPMLTALGATCDVAPVVPGDPLPRANARQFEHEELHAFARLAGIEHELFHPACGLLRECPGVGGIDQRDVARFGAALRDYRSAWPESRPGFGPGLDATHAHLAWLAWWTRWAVATRRTPVIATF